MIKVGDIVTFHKDAKDSHTGKPLSPLRRDGLGVVVKRPSWGYPRVATARTPIKNDWTCWELYEDREMIKIGHDKELAKQLLNEETND